MLHLKKTKAASNKTVIKCHRLNSNLKEIRDKYLMFVGENTLCVKNDGEYL